MRNLFQKKKKERKIFIFIPSNCSIKNFFYFFLERIKIMFIELEFTIFNVFKSSFSIFFFFFYHIYEKSFNGKILILICSQILYLIDIPYKLIYLSWISFFTKSFFWIEQAQVQRKKEYKYK